MLPTVEIRQGGRLHGTVITEGRAASGGRAEVFAPGSVRWPEDGIGILTRHRVAPEVRAMPERQPDGRITIEAPATPAIRAAVADGRKWMSVEFSAEEERTTLGGVREILDATVFDAALVASPEYDVTGAEVRRRLGTGLRGTIPVGRNIDCACPSGGCTSISFASDAFSHLEGLERVVTAGSMDRAVGMGRLSVSDSGDLRIEVDLLDVQAGRDVRTLVAGGVPVYLRPLIDEDGSETTEERRDGGTLHVLRAEFSAVLAKPVGAGVSGLRPASTTRETGENRRGKGRVERSSASESILARSGERRRLWL